MAGKVRHPIDTAALERYITEHVPEIKVPLDVKQFGFGQSNPTYQLTSPSGSKYVLRKKPAGKLVSQAAHKVEREHRIIHALRNTSVPVPQAYTLCTDSSVLGTPFYIMSFITGRIFEDAAMPTATPTQRTELWKAAVEALASLHRVDPDSVGLSTYGKKTGFYDRQLATWTQICALQAATTDIETGVPVGEIPHMSALMSFFSNASLRPKDKATLVHGDYKIDNVVFATNEARVAGILDWEMSTIGHPLSDLANFLHPFVSASMSSRISTSSSSSSDKTAVASVVSHPSFLPNATPGLPTPAQILTWYSAAAGWTPSAEDVAWACAFSVFRLAAICQGIAARVARRQASSAEAQKHAAAMPLLGEFAWELVRREQEKARGAGAGAKL
ncbi:phosphotransferase enzyme family protein [Annulohypoxylon maeteangense]|uniref:phosphotransferase enzyme family protein n=1 Tax=Annulohypoxylon maeteangense TaxID=1927788 RepID=UPI0020075446|nr:phosphotransferase enzyme family protein [Annulohypoxylon maeteangense]KAI0888641.1 phosphotransferase enzyme family protein [Annulohypoxylon maeteangense]